MQRWIILVGAPEDYQSLVVYLKCLGLSHIPRKLDSYGGDPFPRSQNEFGGYLSLLPLEKLKRHPARKYEIHPVENPVIDIMPFRFEPPFLIDGRFHLVNDESAYGKEIKPIFNKIYRWIRKNWKKADLGWTGPSAISLVAEERARYRSCLAGIPVTYVNVKTGEEVTSNDPIKPTR